jgi:hypothetical protein
MSRATVGVSAFCAAALACLLGCTPPTAPPPGAPSGLPPRPSSPFGLPVIGAPPPPETHERRAITDVLVNVCNGETVSLTGELSEDTKVKGSKVEQHIKAHLTGTGNFGNAYKLELDVRSTWDTSAMTMTHKNRYDLKSEGSAPDQRVEVTIRSSPLSIEIKPECRGVPKP